MRHQTTKSVYGVVATLEARACGKKQQLSGLESGPAMARMLSQVLLSGHTSHHSRVATSFLLPHSKK